MTIDLCLCVRFATVCLLSRYMHILPFDNLDRNLIALGPVMFPIALAYSLIAMPSVSSDCKIMAWSWVGEYSCFVTFAYELVDSLGFPVSSLCWILFDVTVVCTHDTLTHDTNTVRVYPSCGYALLCWGH